MRGESRETAGGLQGFTSRGPICAIVRFCYRPYIIAGSADPAAPSVSTVRGWQGGCNDAIQDIDTRYMYEQITAPPRKRQHGICQREGAVRLTSHALLRFECLAQRACEGVLRLLARVSGWRHVQRDVHLAPWWALVGAVGDVET